MRRLTKFGRLPGDERKLLLTSWLLLAGIRLGLWVLSFERLRRWMEPKPCKKPVGSEAHKPQRIAWAVKVASHYVPGAQTCLPRALAARFLLARHGHSAELRLGVTRAGEELKAHAWVVSEGEVVIGGSDVNRFVPLRPPESHDG